MGGKGKTSFARGSGKKRRRERRHVSFSSSDDDDTSSSSLSGDDTSSSSCDSESDYTSVSPIPHAGKIVPPKAARALRRYFTPERLRKVLLGNVVLLVLLLGLVLTRLFNPAVSISNIKRFCAKVDRPIASGTSEEDLWNTVVVEMSKIYHRPVAEIQMLPRKSLDKMADLVLHNGARLYLIAEGNQPLADIMGSDEDHIRNTAIIDLEQETGEDPLRFQNMNAQALDVYALQTMKVPFAYSIGEVGAEDEQKQKFNDYIATMILKYEKGAGASTAADDGWARRRRRLLGAVEKDADALRVRASISPPREAATSY